MLINYFKIHYLKLYRDQRIFYFVGGVGADRWVKKSDWTDEGSVRI